MSQRCQKEMYSKVKLRDNWNLSTKTFFFFFILTIMGRNLYKPYYFLAISDYICISFNLFWMAFIKCAIMYHCCPMGSLRLSRDLTWYNTTWSQAECFLICDSFLKVFIFFMLSNCGLITSLYLPFETLSSSSFLLLIC